MQKIQSNNIYSIALVPETSPQLSIVCRELGEPQAVAFISKTINDAGKMMKCELDSAGVLATAQSILREYKLLPADEILIAFHNGMSGYYGKIYGGLTFPLMFEWMRMYWEERQINIDREHESKKNEWGNNSDRIATNQKSVRELMAELKYMKP